LLQPRCHTALAVTVVMASEKQVQMKDLPDLPDAVQKTFKEQTKTAQLRGLAKEVEKGKTFCEAETTVNGKSRDILIDPAGAVVEVEEEVSLDSIPEAAQKTIRTRAGSGKILKVESVTEGLVVSYEAVIQKGIKKSEVAVNADGTMKKKD
jgi:hypothetical protein